MVRLLVALLGGLAALIGGLVLLVLSVIAAMPWLGSGVPDASGQVSTQPIVVHVAGPLAPQTALPSPMSALPLPPGAFSPLDRYNLALAVGFSNAEAVFATAISLSEDPNGLPTTISPPNRGGTVDIGLMQINSSHCKQVAGGCAALLDPVVNMAFALQLYRSGSGWFQWCTYPGGCGGGPGAPSWLGNLAIATRVAAGN